LKDIKGDTLSSEIYCPPFLLAIDKVYQKIRNIKYRYTKEGTLFPEEVLRYDPFNIREPLNNCIAHRDYTISGRINVVEVENDRLIFSNVGTFIPGSVEEVVQKDTPEERYRNTFLVEAMRNLNLVESEGGGIKKVFKNQTIRFFPLPDYEFGNGKVVVTIQGKVLDMEFARILAQNQSLRLEDIMLLDKVQKRKKLSKPELSYLRKEGFIEGQASNPYLSFHVVKPIQSDLLKVDYMNNKSLDDDYFRKIILEYLRKFPKSKRAALETLLIPKLSAILDQEKKKKKVDNLLYALKKKDLIKVNDNKEWELV
jgi:ATP-dependent DNA helicase RecG